MQLTLCARVLSDGDPRTFAVTSAAESDPQTRPPPAPALPTHHHLHAPCHRRPLASLPFFVSSYLAASLRLIQMPHRPPGTKIFSGRFLWSGLLHWPSPHPSPHVSNFPPGQRPHQSHAEFFQNLLSLQHGFSRQPEFCTSLSSQHATSSWEDSKVTVSDQVSCTLPSAAPSMQKHYQAMFLAYTGTRGRC